MCASMNGCEQQAHVQAVAEAQFAQYLEKQGAQLVGEDVDGQTYDFRFRFWLNNQSRMYLIEGCLEMIKKYKLQKGDVIVFARKADGTLVVGGRPAGPVCCAHAFVLVHNMVDASHAPLRKLQSASLESLPSKNL